MRRALRCLVFATGVCAVATLGASAQTTPEDGPTPSPSWWRAITVNAFAQESYGYNFNRPASETNTLRVFDFDDREIKLDVFELVTQRPVAAAGELGFRIDAAYGQSIPGVTAASGLFRDSSTGEAHDY